MILRYEVRLGEYNNYIVTHVSYFKDTALWCASLLSATDKQLKIFVWDNIKNKKIEEQYIPHQHYISRINKKNKKRNKRKRKYNYSDLAQFGFH